MKQKRIINLTPHDINLYDREGKTEIAVLPAASVPARCEMHRVLSETIQLNGLPIEIYRTELGLVTGLPSPQKNTLYVVSRAVAEKLKSLRTDLIFPDQTVRDDSGRIIGCISFARL